MKLSKDKLITLYTNLVRARAFDKLFIKWLSEGKLLGFFHPAEGGEAPGVGACSFLRKDDFIWPHIRGHGMPHMLSKGVELKYYLAEHTGKSTGMCGGISTFHGCDPDNGIYGLAGTVGSSFPISLGWGIAAQKNGRNQVVVSCFGDGAASRGTFHESAIMAANWKLPIVWVCENNKLGMYVAFKDVHPTEDIADLAQGYGMPGAVVDGQDVVAVAKAVNKAVEQARKGKGPSLIECKCERFQAHAIGLPDYVGPRIRTKEEVDELRKRDPIKICREKLMAQGMLSEKDIKRIDREAAEEIAEAVQFADESPLAEPTCIEPALYAV